MKTEDVAKHIYFLWAFSWNIFPASLIVWSACVPVLLVENLDRQDECLFLPGPFKFSTWFSILPLPTLPAACRGIQQRTLMPRRRIGVTRWKEPRFLNNHKDWLLMSIKVQIERKEGRKDEKKNNEVEKSKKCGVLSNGTQKLMTLMSRGRTESLRDRQIAPQ